MRLAAIDIGSNSILLTVIDARSSETFEIVHDEATVVGLAKGLQYDAVIQDLKIAEAGKVLLKYLDTCRKIGAEQIFIAATEALRRAANGHHVKQHLETLIGHKISIITGDQEAEYSFWSVQKCHPETDAMKVVFDIGGASTELCLGNTTGIVERVSLKMGSVMLTEKFHLQEPHDSTKTLAFCRNTIQEGLRDLKYLSGESARKALGIGVAGTITTLFAMNEELTTYHRDAVDFKSMSRPRIFEWLQNVARRNTEDRALYPGLPLDRADVVAGGFAIAYGLADWFQWPSIVCLDRGVRFGILLSEIAHGKFRPVS